MDTRYPLAVLTHTNRPIENVLPDTLWDNFDKLSDRCGMIEDILGTRLLVSSGYRCEELNKAVGGAAGSAHRTCEAVDITCRNLSPIVICKRIIQAGAVESLGIDQLIFEGSWVHVGFRFSVRPRRELLTRKIKPETGKVIYTKGIDFLDADV